MERPKPKVSHSKTSVKNSKGADAEKPQHRQALHHRCLAFHRLWSGARRLVTRRLETIPEARQPHARGHCQICPVTAMAIGMNQQQNHAILGGSLCSCQMSLEAHGPMSSVIATLMDSDWTPREAHKWKS